MLSLNDAPNYSTNFTSGGCKVAPHNTVPQSTTVPRGTAWCIILRDIEIMCTFKYYFTLTQNMFLCFVSFLWRLQESVLLSGISSHTKSCQEWQPRHLSASQTHKLSHGPRCAPFNVAKRKALQIQRLRQQEQKVEGRQGGEERGQHSTDSEKCQSPQEKRKWSVGGHFPRYRSK